VLDGKEAVKNLYTRASHLHYTRAIALELNYSAYIAVTFSCLRSSTSHIAADVGVPEDELRLVSAEERRVPTAFVLAQDVDFILEFQPRANQARNGYHLAEGSPHAE
jgi:hypothetical protein